METLTQLWELVDLPYLISFMFATWMVLKLNITLLAKVNKTLIGVIVATMLGFGFYILGSDLKQLSVSYFLGTSMYEVIIKFLLKKLGI